MGRPRTVNVQGIVDAAARVFERRGYSDATLADIACEAGVSKPTIYQYFESKQRLLEIIVEKVVALLRDGVDKVVASSDSPREKLESYVRVHVESATRFRVYYLVLMADQQQLTEEGRRQHQSWARQVNQAAFTVLQEGIEAGVVRPDLDLPVAVNMLNSTLSSIARWYREDGRLSIEDIHREAMKFLSGVLLPANRD